MKKPEPDAPQSFGYKCIWLALRTGDPTAVARALGLGQPEACTWATGVRGAYEGRVFVTPSLGPWVLAASISLPDSGQDNAPDHASPLLERLGELFPEVQYFGTHRAVEWHAWARVIRGALVRKFAYVGDQGSVPWNLGSPTPEEVALGPVFTPDTIDAGFCPDEAYVMALTARWSVDPSTLERQQLGPGLGVVGTLPHFCVA